MEVQHLFSPRTLKGDRRLDVTEHAAELSKDGPKAKAEKIKNSHTISCYPRIPSAQAMIQSFITTHFLENVR